MRPAAWQTPAADAPRASASSSSAPPEKAGRVQLQKPASRNPSRRFPAPVVPRPSPRIASQEESFLNPFREFFGTADEADEEPTSGNELPPAPKSPRVRIPVAGPDPVSDGQLSIQKNGNRIRLLRVQDQELSRVLAVLAEQQGVNIVTQEGISSRVTVTLRDISFEEALDALLSVGGYTWTRRNNVILVTRISVDSNVAPSVQGREIRVFPLNFVSAADVQGFVTQLLSPAGKSYITETGTGGAEGGVGSPVRGMRELIVVEDLPAYLARVENYIAQVDQPPRQVLIEAHVFQVDLSDENRHGVNFEYLTEIAGSSVTLSTTGFANPLASPALLLNLDGTDLDAIVEALKTTTDAKTLASPRVLALNGQQARIQIGSQFGYFVTTTTQTSTLQNVEFLEVGVVLNVTPYITDDNRVMMTVKPEVSNGRINPDTGLPEEDTTEVETTVMLADNHGMVIGGLIKEEDTDVQSKIPIAGDLWLVGRLFQRRTTLRERSEIIVVLIPRIVPYTVDYDPLERSDTARASTRLMQPNLKRIDRPWDAVLPDAERNPRRPKLRRLPHLFTSPFEPFPRPLQYFFPAKTEVNPYLRGRLE